MVFSSAFHVWLPTHMHHLARLFLHQQIRLEVGPEYMLIPYEYQINYYWGFELQRLSRRSCRKTACSLLHWQSETNENLVSMQKKNYWTNASVRSIYALTCKERRLSLRISEESVNFTLLLKLKANIVFLSFSFSGKGTENMHVTNVPHRYDWNCAT